MTWPASELHFWSVVFSVEDDLADPEKRKILTKPKSCDEVGLEESKNSLRDLVGD
ncbi:hypothetical protein VP393E501_P0013 [Vibrio phage 393E50-1]|nr:hypothetical protein VP489E541_P0018 [Vibrio phage 489E54-1]CAH9015557.1 hypothetical protein VP393E501_P0013 [Vibrio phage 393E50-1]